MSSETEVIRRKGSRKVTKSTRQQNGDSSKGRRNKRRDARNKQLTLILSALAAVILLFLLLRGAKKDRIAGLNSDRFERAKALRDAALKSGKSFLRKTTKKIDSVTRPHRGRKDYDLKKKFKGMRYLDPRQLPPLPGEPKEPYAGRKHPQRGFSGDGDDDWVPIAESLEKHVGPKLDYVKHKYKYPELVYEPVNDGTYPPLDPMREVFQTWEQDDVDSPPDTIVEVLQHFDYQDPEQVEVRFLGCFLYPLYALLGAINTYTCTFV